MEDLAIEVVKIRYAEAPSRVVVSVAPVVDDGFLGTITIDVVGLQDDSLRGERIVIIGDGFDQAGDGFMFGNAESTALCSRGVTETGLCI